MAGMVVAGIIHVMINQPPPAAAPIQKQTPRPDPMGFAAANFWNDWMQGLMSPGTRQNEHGALSPEKRPVEKAGAPAPANALPRQPSASNATKEVAFDGFQEMVNTGIQVQEQNVKAMQDIFTAFWSTQNKEKSVVGKPQDEPVSEPHGEDTTTTPGKSANQANKPVSEIK